MKVGFLVDEPRDPAGAVQGAPESHAPLQRPAPRVANGRWWNGELTPSEACFLKHLRWTREFGEEGESWLKVGGPEHGHEPIKMALAVAFLANVEAGVFRLEYVREPYFFGLFTNEELRVSSTNNGYVWPDGSLEQEIQSRIFRGPTVRAMIYDWLETDRLDPWSVARNDLLQTLERRRVLQPKAVRTRFLVFSWTSRHHEIPGKTARSVRELEAHADRLLQEYAVSPRDYTVLLSQIEDAFRGRTSSA